MIITKTQKLSDEEYTSSPHAINSIIFHVWEQVLPQLQLDEPVQVNFSVLDMPITWYDTTTSHFLSVAAEVH